MTGMTRFSAATRAEREELFADAIAAHRERGSAFCTFQCEFDADNEATAREEDDADEPATPPWIQFGDGTLNLDCTDEELDRLKALVGEFPSFTVDQLHSPEDADGTNVRVTARTDADRVAQFVERAFREAYDQPDTYVAWVTEL